MNDNTQRSKPSESPLATANGPHHGQSSSAVDASRAMRPGVPMEADPPRPAGFAHWSEPDRQQDPGNVLRRKGLAELTPVFGTANPPRGLSGAMRRAAYNIPEHRTGHWLMLLLADRVDAWEHGPWRLAPLAMGLLAGGAATTVAWMLLIQPRQRRRAPWLRRLFAG